MDYPVPAFRYHVGLGSGRPPASLDGGDAAMDGFTDCSGLEVSVEILDLVEGGVNDYVHKLPTRTRHSDIVLKRGMLSSRSELWAWIYEVSLGRYRRRDGYVALYSLEKRLAGAWTFRRGLPSRWSGPVLSASQSAVATESLTIAHEGLVKVY